MEGLCESKNLNTLLTKLMKYLLIGASFTLVTPVFATDKQDLSESCFDKYMSDDDSMLTTCLEEVKQSDPRVQLIFGTIYKFGRGTPQDHKQAL